MSDPRRVDGRRELDRLRSERLGWLEERVDGLEKCALSAVGEPVARAVRDTNVDRDLRDHAEHLAQINGSQERMSGSLFRLEDHVAKLAEIFARQAAVTEALAGQAADASGRRFSIRTQWLMALGALGGYGGVIVALLTH